MKSTRQTLNERNFQVPHWNGQSQKDYWWRSTKFISAKPHTCQRLALHKESGNNRFNRHGIYQIKLLAGINQGSCLPQSETKVRTSVYKYTVFDSIFQTNRLAL